MISIQKREKVYQYRFEVARVNGKRKYLSKSGFKTKSQAFAAGQKAYDEYQNGGCKIEAYMSYSDYLDYWLENYCKDNLKHRTIEEYFVIAISSSELSKPKIVIKNFKIDNLINPF